MTLKNVLNPVNEEVRENLTLGCKVLLRSEPGVFEVTDIGPEDLVIVDDTRVVNLFQIESIVDYEPEMDCE